MHYIERVKHLFPLSSPPPFTFCSLPQTFCVLLFGIGNLMLSSFVFFGTLVLPQRSCWRLSWQLCDNSRFFFYSMPSSCCCCRLFVIKLLSFSYSCYRAHFLYSDIKCQVGLVKRSKRQKKYFCFGFDLSLVVCNCSTIVVALFVSFDFKWRLMLIVVLQLPAIFKPCSIGASKANIHPT